MLGGVGALAAALLVITVGLPTGVAHAQAPAAEGPCPGPCLGPDALIRLRRHPVAVGDGVYDPNGVGQTRVAFVRRGATARFVVRVENDGTATDDLVVQGSRNADHFSVRYSVGGDPVSTRVRNGNLRFEDVAPGSYRVLALDVTAKGSSPPRARFIGRVAVRSGTDGTIKDRVKAVVYRSDTTRSVIVGRAFAGLPAAQRWARNEGASAQFVRNAELYWELAPSRGVRPDVAYAQSGKETARGNFGGVLDESWRNPCGLKTAAGGSDDDPQAHRRFDNWRQGVMACIDHLALYAGAPGYPRANTPDPRHYPHLLGTAPTVESLGARWAPSPDYGRSIVRDHLKPLLGS